MKISRQVARRGAVLTNFAAVSKEHKDMSRKSRRLAARALTKIECDGAEYLTWKEGQEEVERLTENEQLP